MSKIIIFLPGPDNIPGLPVKFIVNRQIFGARIEESRQLFIELSSRVAILGVGKAATNGTQ